MSSCSLDINAQTPSNPLQPSATIKNKTQVYDAKKKEYDDIPSEIWRIVFQFCDQGTLLCFSSVNYLAYCQVSDYFNSITRSILSLVLALDLNEDVKRFFPEITNDNIYGKKKNKEILARATEKYEFIKSLGDRTIVKGVAPSISKLFKPGPLFQLDKSFLLKNLVPQSEKSFLEQSFLTEQFVRRILFPKSISRRWNLAEAAKLFINNNRLLFNPKITIQDIQKICSLDPEKMPAIVWSDSSGEAPITDCLPSTVIHPVHTAFFCKKFFTLYDQGEESDIYAYLGIHPKYILNGISAYNWNPNDQDNQNTFSILKGILNSRMFYHEAIYDEINGILKNPMHCNRVSEKFFKLLLEGKFNVNILNEYGLSPLDNAIFRGNTELILLFIEYGADIHRKYLDDLLLMAISKNNAAILEKALMEGANIHEEKRYFSKYFTPLQHAVNNNASFEIIELLIKYGAKVNVIDHMNKTPLDIAAINLDIAAIKNEHAEIVQFLQENGALPGSDYRLLPARIWLAFKTHILSEIRGIASSINLCSIALMAICGLIEACNIYIYLSLLIIFSLSGLIVVIPPIYSFLYTAIYKKIFPTTE